MDTMDDATGEHLSMFFCDEEGAASSFHRVGQTIARYGLFCALYTDRGSHYFHTSQAGEKVDANTGTQLDERWRYGYRVHWSTLRPIGRRLMGVQSGPSAYTSSAYPASWKAGITDMQQAKVYLEQRYMPRYNAKFAVPAAEPGNAFVSYIGNGLAAILCKHYGRVVGNNNCVMFGRRLKLQSSAERTGSLWQAARAGASLREWRSEPAHAWQSEIEDQQVERLPRQGNVGLDPRLDVIDRIARMAE